MNNNLVKLKFHGNNWRIPTDWDLNVKSVGEAMRAVEANTNKLYSELIKKDKDNIKYCLVINGRNFKINEKMEDLTIDEIKESELTIGMGDLKTIDVIPVIEGSNSSSLGIFTAVLGVILIVIGAILLPTGIGAALLVGGIGLLAAGVFSLLSKPPSFEDFREIEQGGKTNYLFSGPQNIIGEGGPVPLGYGRLIVGSQTVSAAFTTTDFDTEDTSKTIRNEYNKLNYIEFPVPPPIDEGISYDSDAQDFLDRAVLNSYSPTVKLAINTLVVDFKVVYGASNLWDKIVAFYPFVGSTSDTHSHNLKSSNYQITWNGSEDHSSFGIGGNGTDFYGDTNLNLFSVGGFQNDVHVYVYNRTKQLLNWRYLLSANSTDGNERLGLAPFGLPAHSSTPQYLYIGNAGVNSDVTTLNTFSVKGGVNQRGHAMVGRLDGTTIYRKGLSTDYGTKNYNEIVTNAPNSNIYILARSWNGAINLNSHSNANLAAASIGYSMTDEQVTAFFAAIHKFQVSLGREV